MKSNIFLGRKGEKEAEKFLKKKGFKILGKNFRSRQGEIDIIAQEQEEIVFVEVKTRSSDNFGYPEESVDKRKLNKIKITAEKYLEKNCLTEKSCRIDVISILKGKEMHIDHFENVSGF